MEEEKKEKKKVSAAQLKATAKWEKNNYFKTLVRFPADMEPDIRNASGDSLNGFIVQAVREKLDRITGDRSTGQETGGGPSV